MRGLLLMLLLVCSNGLYAQYLYRIYLKHKDTAKPELILSDKAIQRRKALGIAITETDYPVSSTMLDSLRAFGLEVISKSKWQNTVTVNAASKSLQEQLRNNDHIVAVQFLGERMPFRKGNYKTINERKAQQPVVSADEKNKAYYGSTFEQVEQLGVPSLHRLGFEGANILVAVLDAGFANAHKIPALSHLVTPDLIKQDFVQRDTSVFEDDEHGLAVLSCMAACLPGTAVGTAPKATYALLRTEYAPREMPVEESFWAEAIEYADSIGADLVSSSLGYNNFDDARFSYTHKQLNGKSFISTQAAIAVAKGIVVVNSAGNEGDEDWKKICVPADASGVITVGGVDKKGVIAGFSSVGPTVDKQIKPDVVARGSKVFVASPYGTWYEGDGTSYACPLISGAIACLMQAHPARLPSYWQQMLHLGGSGYAHPDNNTGYGIPDIDLIHHLVIADSVSIPVIVDVRVLEDQFLHAAWIGKKGQTTKWIIRNQEGMEVLTCTTKCEYDGANRSPLKGSKKLPKGKYSVTFIGSTNTFNFTR